MREKGLGDSYFLVESASGIDLVKRNENECTNELIFSTHSTVPCYEIYLNYKATAMYIN